MSRMTIDATRELISRYRQVFALAWSNRRATDIETRPSHEATFLPAHLEIVETPIHPLPRLTMRVIVLATLLTFVISIVGELDIVVVAKGELIPDSSVKVIQPAITGVVTKILVRDGERVRVGQPLVSMDTRQAAADASTTRNQRIHAELAIARAQSLLEAVGSGLAPLPANVSDASRAESEQSYRLAVQTWQAFVDKRDDARSHLLASQAELAGVHHEIDKLKATAPLARRQADAYRILVAQSDVASSDYLDKEQAALTQEHDVLVKKSQAEELSSMVGQQRAVLANITSEFLRDQRIELEKSTQTYTESLSSESKASIREDLLTLRAPVDGTVQQLSIHSPGGVVTTAQVLMDVVPNDTLMVKSSIDNRDVGFVRGGQDVVVKVAAYPYTHYGYIKGTVINVANDAVLDRQRGSSFIAYVRLQRGYIQAGDRRVALTPGMAVTTEIKTGERSVISYFVDPLLKVAEESLHER